MNCRHEKTIVVSNILDIWFSRILCAYFKDLQRFSAKSLRILTPQMGQFGFALAKKNWSVWKLIRPVFLLAVFFVINWRNMRLQYSVQYSLRWISCIQYRGQKSPWYSLSCGPLSSIIHQNPFTRVNWCFYISLLPIGCLYKKDKTSRFCPAHHPLPEEYSQKAASPDLAARLDFVSIWIRKFLLGRTPQTPAKALMLDSVGDYMLFFGWHISMGTYRKIEY